MEFAQLLYALWADLTTVPAREQRTTLRYLGTESCFQCVSVFSPTSSPLVPYFMLSSLPK